MVILYSRSYVSFPKKPRQTMVPIFSRNLSWFWYLNLALFCKNSFHVFDHKWIKRSLKCPKTYLQSLSYVCSMIWICSLWSHANQFYKKFSHLIGLPNELFYPLPMTVRRPFACCILYLHIKSAAMRAWEKVLQKQLL